MKAISWPLLIGDFLTLGLVTAAGLFFHMHSSLARLPYTWLPWGLAWILVAGSLGLLAAEPARQWSSLPRVIWAAILAAPLAGLLREVMEGGDAILLLFVVIMAGITCLGLLAWRALYIWLAQRNG